MSFFQDIKHTVPLVVNNKLMNNFFSTDPLNLTRTKYTKREKDESTREKSQIKGVFEGSTGQ
jgi:hypothetical protein